MTYLSRYCGLSSALTWMLIIDDIELRRVVPCRREVEKESQWSHPVEGLLAANPPLDRSTASIVYESRAVQTSLRMCYDHPY